MLPSPAAATSALARRRRNMRDQSANAHVPRRLARWHRDVAIARTQLAVLCEVGKNQGMAGSGRKAACAFTSVIAALVAAPAASAGTWYAGDGHVHTCYSHDSYCGPDDDNTGPDTIYSSGGTVAQRFAEAAAKGLDFVVISDHDDIRAQADPAYGTQGVAALPAYEASLS